jgi:hypothetical protein
MASVMPIRTQVTTDVELGIVVRFATDAEKPAVPPLSDKVRLDFLLDVGGIASGRVMHHSPLHLAKCQVRAHSKSFEGSTVMITCVSSDSVEVWLSVEQRAILATLVPSS